MSGAETYVLEESADWLADRILDDRRLRRDWRVFRIGGRLVVDVRWTSGYGLAFELEDGEVLVFDDPDLDRVSVEVTELVPSAQEHDAILRAVEAREDRAT